MLQLKDAKSPTVIPYGIRNEPSLIPCCSCHDCSLQRCFGHSGYFESDRPGRHPLIGRFVLYSQHESEHHLERHDNTQKETTMNADTTEPDVPIQSPTAVAQLPVSEVSMPPTLWRDGPSVKISLANRAVKIYKSRALVDASVILFQPQDETEKFSSWTALEGHPFWSIARSIERCEWHAPSEESLKAIGSDPTAGKVCLFGLETHFVRAPLGDTFSACRLGLSARELGGVRAVAVVGLVLGDILLVKGAVGYAAIARRSQPVSSAPMLWAQIDAQTTTK
jgi:hypothetical protein